MPHLTAAQSIGLFDMRVLEIRCRILFIKIDIDTIVISERKISLRHVCRGLPMKGTWKRIFIVAILPLIGADDCDSESSVSYKAVSNDEVQGRLEPICQRDVACRHDIRCATSAWDVEKMKKGCGAIVGIVGSFGDSTQFTGLLETVRQWPNAPWQLQHCAKIEKRGTPCCIKIEACTEHSFLFNRPGHTMLSPPATSSTLSLGASSSAH